MVLMNNSPYIMNIFQLLVLLKRYHQNSHAVLAATGINGLLYFYILLIIYTCISRGSRKKI